MTQNTCVSLSYSPLVSKVGALERSLRPHEGQLSVDVGEPRDVRGSRHTPPPARDQGQNAGALLGDRVAFVQNLSFFCHILRARLWGWSSERLRGREVKGDGPTAVLGIQRGLHHTPTVQDLT